MLAKRPMVVGYRIAPSTYALVKMLGMLKIERYALPNVLAGEDVAPELMQDDCTPENLSQAVLHWFKHPEAVAALQPKYLELHRALRQDASARAADAVADLVPSPHAASVPARRRRTSVPHRRNRRGWTRPAGRPGRRRGGNVRLDPAPHQRLGRFEAAVRIPARTPVWAHRGARTGLARRIHRRRGNRSHPHLSRDDAREIGRAAGG